MRKHSKYFSEEVFFAMKNLFVRKKGKKKGAKKSISTTISASGRQARSVRRQTKKSISTATSGNKKVVQNNQNYVDDVTRQPTPRNKRPVQGCKMILCEDPVTGNIRLFPVECPKGYVERVRSKAREKGIRFSPEPFPEDAFLSLPEDE